MFAAAGRFMLVSEAPTSCLPGGAACAGFAGCVCSADGALADFSFSFVVVLAIAVLPQLLLSSLLSGLGFFLACVLLFSLCLGHLSLNRPAGYRHPEPDRGHEGSLHIYTGNRT